jgi:putative alpha-1,2-mannosidase
MAQYQWPVPQDPAGLVRLMGGRAATERRLDDFFGYDKLLTDPAGTAGTDFLAVSSPQFPSAKVRVGARTPTVSAPGASAAKRPLRAQRAGAVREAGPLDHPAGRPPAACLRDDAHMTHP